TCRSPRDAALARALYCPRDERCRAGAVVAAPLFPPPAVCSRRSVAAVADFPSFCVRVVFAFDPPSPTAEWMAAEAWRAALGPQRTTHNHQPPTPSSRPAAIGAPPNHFSICNSRTGSKACLRWSFSLLLAYKLSSISNKRELWKGPCPPLKGLSWLSPYQAHC